MAMHSRAWRLRISSGGGQVEVGEEDLALADARNLLRQRLLDLEDELGLPPYAVGHRHHGARASIVVVAESAAPARVRLDEDAVPASAKARAPAGVRATRCSPTLISFGTPTTMATTLAAGSYVFSKSMRS